jgi:CheY-like chemotaxis protein
MAHLAVLAKIRGLSAVGAATVAEARALIHEARPQVVVLDMRLPDGTGLDVIAALEATGANAVVIVASAYLDDYRSKLSRNERLHLLGKPVPMHELRRIVEATMTNTNVLGPFTVIDYVQLACMGHHSAVIECFGSAGRGEIIVERGELWSAEDPAGKGLPAFERLLMAKKATAQQLSGQRTRGPRNLNERWELLILDALRAQDEQGSRGAAPTAPATNPAPIQPAHQATPQPAHASQAAPPSASGSLAAPASAQPSPGGTPANKTVPTAIPATATTTAPAQSATPAGTTRAPQTSAVESGRAEPTKATTLPRLEARPTGTETAATSVPSSSQTRRDDGFDACIERALRAVVAKNFTLAITELEQAQRLRPEDAMVIHRLARLRSLQP